MRAESPLHGRIDFSRNKLVSHVYCLHAVLSLRPIFITAALLIAQLMLPLAWLGHEALERREDAQNDAIVAAAIARGQKPGKTEEHHDESRCNVCQAVAAVRGHMTTPPADCSIQILERAHETAAILIVAEREQYRATLAHPRGPPSVV